MMKELPILDFSSEDMLEKYEAKFKAIADKKRLHILHELTKRKEACVCDLQPVMDMPQSKLSYHLKLLLDANLIKKDKRGTWNYYSINEKEINHLLSEELCCVFRPN